MDNWKYPYYSYKVLPLVYDEALSYWQQIIMLYGKINEVLKIVQNISADYESADIEVLKKAKAYADSITAKLQSDFTSLSIQINHQINELQNEMFQFTDQQKEDLQAGLEEIQNNVDYQLNTIHNSLAALWIAMNYLFYQQDDYMQKIYIALKQYIDETVAYTTGAKIMVINPILGSVTSLNKALDDVLNYIAHIGSITMLQYDKMHLTMNEYESYQVTFIDYSLKGYFIFFERLALMDFSNHVNEQLLEMSTQITNIDNKVKKSTTLMNPYSLRTDSVKSIIPYLVDQTAPTFYEYNTSQIEYNYYNKQKIKPQEYRKMGAALYFFQLLFPHLKTGLYLPFYGYATPNVIILQGRYEQINTENSPIKIMTLSNINMSYLGLEIIESDFIVTPKEPLISGQNNPYMYCQNVNNDIDIYLSTNVSCNIKWIIKRHKKA